MKIKELVISFIIRQKNKSKLKCARSAIIDNRDFFEGNNFIGQNASVLDCFMGNASYIAFESNLSHCIIGRYTCIGPYVKIISGKHPVRFASIHPFFYTKENQIGLSFVEKTKFKEHDYIDTEHHYHVLIGNDVWIGSGAQIMAGIKVGDGAIIAAGALVTKDVSPYTIVAGVPAKEIKKRFDEETIARFIKIRWWDSDETIIKDNAELFEDVEQMLNKFEDIIDHE